MEFLHIPLIHGICSKAHSPSLLLISIKIDNVGEENIFVLSLIDFASGTISLHGGIFPRSVPPGCFPCCRQVASLAADTSQSLQRAPGTAANYGWDGTEGLA
ncbi:hypothetical protein RRG08_004506 [Elysia crispata]|uniref:Uncharacterized protein n=1 Tax=Elysia crispata TaxID=231223 RepID=A0AAE1EC93_9GAST|nr:hypothetical protein RRG08_004506 [Elysia crispata]